MSVCGGILLHRVNDFGYATCTDALVCRGF